MCEEYIGDYDSIAEYEKELKKGNSKKEVKDE